ncbi:hypothetical protein F5B20DRAFT_592144 [Whalleya microplaca]|nr:hypothetical protein F5B20DRAFT_592144 [Whalleya microplaca]
MLFRKEILMPQVMDAERPMEETVLDFLTRDHSLNVAQILFAYIHIRDASGGGKEMYSNLVFRYYPLDLEKVISGRLTSTSDSDNMTRELEAGARSNLFTSINNTPTLAENPLWAGMINILEAVRRLHKLDPPVKDKSNDKCIGGHFDIKPANILVNTETPPDLVITDFGQARLKRLTHQQTSDITATPGTYDYQPPRHESKKLKRLTDIWSLACVLTEVLVFLHSGSKDLESASQDIVRFREERKKESENGDEIESSNFWTYVRRDIEQLIPLRLYKPVHIRGEENRIAFRYTHRESEFSFSERKDMDILFAALTKQLPRKESTPVLAFGSSDSIDHGTGTLQILQELTNTRYKQLFQTNQLKEDTSITSDGSLRPRVIRYRLVIYSYEKPYLVTELGGDKREQVSPTSRIIRTSTLHILAERMGHGGELTHPLGAAECTPSTMEDHELQVTIIADKLDTNSFRPFASKEHKGGVKDGEDDGSTYDRRRMASTLKR